MSRIKFTLVADGSSDRVLLRVIEWLVQQHTDIPVRGELATALPPIADGLRNRVARALELFPCDILFVHRDAEGQPLNTRVNEIHDACDGVFASHIPVVPVRMTESWLLGDISAIRRAAGNPYGAAHVNIPVKHRWEETSDPKRLLRDVLKAASNLSARRLDKVSIGSWVARVGDLTEDWSHLRGLSSFDCLEAKTIACLRPLEPAI